MKKIELTQNKFALVDDDVYEYLNQWKWYATKSSDGRRWYAARGEPTQRMHRVITNSPKGTVVDHIDGNGLNNQRSNLRICTNAENMRNRDKQSNNTSGYKGVWRRGNRFLAAIWVNRKKILLGSYPTREEASKAYDEASIKYHGEFSKPNLP